MDDTTEERHPPSRRAPTRTRVSAVPIVHLDLHHVVDPVTLDHRDPLQYSLTGPRLVLRAPAGHRMITSVRPESGPLPGRRRGKGPDVVGHWHVLGLVRRRVAARAGHRPRRPRP